MVSLNSLPSSDLRAFLDSFDDILCDCDGVIWKLQSAIPGAAESLARLKKLGKRVRFMSNNCTMTQEQFLETLEGRLKIGVRREDIVFPTIALVNYFKKINFQKEIYVFGFPAMKEEFVKAGFTLAYPGPDRFIGGPVEAMKLIKDNEAVGAVVVELDVNLNYVKLMMSAIYLQRPDVLFLGGGTDYVIPTGLNYSVIGGGHFIDILKKHTGREALCFGKPTETFNEYVREWFAITNPARTLVIGDSLDQDIAFAKKFGYQSLLTLTGVASLGDVEENCDQDVRPDFYIESLGDLHQLIGDDAGSSQ